LNNHKFNFTSTFPIDTISTESALRILKEKLESSAKKVEDTALEISNKLSLSLSNPNQKTVEKYIFVFASKSVKTNITFFFSKLIFVNKINFWNTQLLQQISNLVFCSFWHYFYSLALRNNER